MLDESELKKARRAFNRCKGQCSPSNVNRRVDSTGKHIEFKLSFDEWLTIWLESGFWEKRGCGQGQYVMSRYNDVGDYELNNVFIQLHAENTKEAHVGKSRGSLSTETKEKLSKANLGKQVSQNTREKIRAANIGKVLSDETKEKIRKAKLGNTNNLGKKRGPLSEETKRKISEAKRKKHDTQ